MYRNSSLLQVILLLSLMNGCEDGKPRGAGSVSGSGSQRLSDKAWVIYFSADDVIQFLIITSLDPNDFSQTSSGSGAGPEEHTFSGYWKDQQGNFFLKYSGNSKDGLVNSVVNGKTLVTEAGQILYMAGNGEVTQTKWSFIGSREELVNEHRMVESMIEAFQQANAADSKAAADC